MQKIKTGDNVVIIAGKDKGKSGKVLRYLRKAERVIVEHANLVKKHVRPDPSKEKPGGIIEKEASIHISNVALVNPRTGKADRVGFKMVDGIKRRFFKSDNEIVEIKN